MSMNNEAIKKYLLDFQEKKLPVIKKRGLVLGASNKIQTVIGARRTGKTYLLYAKMKKIEDRKNSREQIMYLNFENPILDDLSYKNIKEVVDLQRELFQNILDKKIYLFIDEPQVIDKWEMAIRNLQDDYNVQIFLTGSSSRLLSKEIATSLRGRSLSFHLLTLSFKEYLDFLMIDYKKVSSKKQSTVKNRFKKYLQSGGYPEIVLEKSQDSRIRILQDYLNLTIFKDLVERYDVKNTDLVRILIDLIVAANSNEFSLNKYYLNLKSRGIRLSKDTLYEYFNYLTDSFFVFALKKFSYSRRTENLSIVKIYLGDVGFMNLYSLENYGIRLENIVFLELLRKTYKNPLLKLNYWKSDDNYEVDFVISQSQKVVEAIQVSLEMNNEKTREREIRALLVCLEKFNLKSGLILTNDEEDEFQKNGKRIKVMPVWKWLLK